jgi:hypothetical protein
MVLAYILRNSNPDKIEGKAKKRKKVKQANPYILLQDR